MLKQIDRFKRLGNYQTRLFEVKRIKFANLSLDLVGARVPAQRLELAFHRRDPK
jgi:hypothetical protein